ncbi:hypothetical protein PYW07_011697 [Mythimna separata]|uniref:G-patch domain-containing protein n=1 Tax=Mythimna separata TaxID=271217 RepID=A0AAD7Y6W7_MYTSE|nr:hypothetical protein PYW07_011697 [Mythimna separata]
MVLVNLKLLKSKSLDVCREACNKILNAASCYIVNYFFEYRDNLKKMVMVVIKEPHFRRDLLEEDSSHGSWSNECTEAATVRTVKNHNLKQKKIKNPADNISSGFKVHCLRTLLAFIKHDETKSKQFPELTPDQALYMESLLDSDGTCSENEKSEEVRELYRALWEAMQILGLKYEFKIKSVDSWCGQKNVTFKKILKQKPAANEDSNETENPKPETENLDTPMPDDSEVCFAKPDKSEACFAKADETGTCLTKADETEACLAKPDETEACFAKPETPTPPSVLQTNRLIKSLLQHQRKQENEVLFIKGFPPQFVSDTLNSILEFILDDGKDKLVFLPKDQPELCFHRKVVDWCRWYSGNFGEEFEKLHHKITSLLPRFEVLATNFRSSKRNAVTGVKEVVYIKKWHTSKSGSLESVRSARKKKKRKVNLQNALELAGKEQIKLSSVVDLNQSLRHKKKNKKQKKAKSQKANAMHNNKVASMEASKSKTWTDDDSSACSSRSASRDRSKQVAKALADKRIAKENHARRNEAKSRSAGESSRKEQLKEAMSVPIQSDRAERMMRGMGWSGGALGPRGDGITEPIMPSLDIPRGAGLGHNTVGYQPVPTGRNPTEIRTTSSWVSENPKVIEKTENAIIEKQTQELLRENPTDDSVELPQPLEPNVELEKPLELNIEFKEPSEPNVEYSKSMVIKILFRELPGTFLDAKFFRDCRIAQIIKIMPYPTPIHPMPIESIKPTESKLPTEPKLPTETKTDELKKPTAPKKPAEPKKPTAPKKPTEPKNPTQQILPLQTMIINTDVISGEFVKGFILSTNSFSNNSKANSVLKFKILFLFNVLKFIKSENEESEVTFSKILTVKEQNYIQNIIDEANMRIRFGSTVAESKLCSEIVDNIGNTFLGAMFNHKYTVVTLTKYYRFKSANRPDNPVKHKCKTKINLNTYNSETVNETNVDTSLELTYKENNNKVTVNNNVDDENEIEFTENEIKFAENCSKFADTYSTVAKNDSEIAENTSSEVKTSNNTVEDDNVLPDSSEDELTNPYDSDESSIEEYCNKDPTAIVPSLPPGEEGVDLSGFISLYDEGKPNTSSIKVSSHFNNVTASKVTENVNNKNNIGNGNVVIDNNDNQIIDMKKDGDTNTNLRMAEEVMDAIDSEVKHIDVVTASDDGLVKLEEKHERIDKKDEDLSNNKGPTDENAIVAKKRENISSGDVYVFTGNTTNNSKDTDVIMTENVTMKENVIEMMEVISITDNADSKKNEIVKKDTESKCFKRLNHVATSAHDSAASDRAFQAASFIHRISNDNGGHRHGSRHNSMAGLGGSSRHPHCGVREGQHACHRLTRRAWQEQVRERCSSDTTAWPGSAAPLDTLTVACEKDSMHVTVSLAAHGRNR